jgi:hypothetical protein
MIGLSARDSGTAQNVVNASAQLAATLDAVLMQVTFVSRGVLFNFLGTEAISAHSRSRGGAPKSHDAAE